MPKLAAAVIGAWIGVAASQPADLDTLLQRLDAYFTDYEPALSALVAREVMTQTIEAPSRSRVASLTLTDKRRLESEVAFMALPGDTAWLGIRVVQKVNGKAVPSMADAFGALRRSDQPVALANRILAESARHNLGSVRNTNLPNLPLELLHRRNRDRFAYAIDGHASIGGTRATVVQAIETGVPPLIRTPSGAELSTRVRAWLDDRGRVLRAEVRLRNPQIRGVQDEPLLRVEFRHSQKLDLLVPVEMREESSNTSTGVLEVTVAKYSEFRRFESSARIVPQ
jgi:hypothetical protein